MFSKSLLNTIAEDIWKSWKRVQEDWGNLLWLPSKGSYKRFPQSFHSEAIHMLRLFMAKSNAHPRIRARGSALVALGDR